MTENKDIRFKVSYAMEEAEKITQNFEPRVEKGDEISELNIKTNHVRMQIAVAKMILSELNRKENKKEREEADKNFEQGFKEFNDNLFRRFRAMKNSKKEKFDWQSKYLGKPNPIKVGDICPYCAKKITSKDHYCNYG